MVLRRLAEAAAGGGRAAPDATAFAGELLEDPLTVPVTVAPLAAALEGTKVCELAVDDGLLLLTSTSSASRLLGGTYSGMGPGA